MRTSATGRAAAMILGLLATAPAAAQRGPLPGFTGASPYYIYYGNWSAQRITAARTNFRLVIIEPRSNITAANVTSIKRGPDNILGTADDVLVLAYISIGEDARPGIFDGSNNIIPTPGGTGPRIDPRAPGASMASTLGPGGAPSLGLPSPGGTGYASFYLDSAPFDGLPDRNSQFGGAYVNPGDPAWYSLISTMRVANEGLAGLAEIMTPSYGKALNCDGVFLDTLDACAPNSFGATQHEWTTPGMRHVIERMSTDYPSKFIVANRGLFFFSPAFEHYEFNPRPLINGLMFESYYTDSSDSHEVTPNFADHRYNFAPKINAEAQRPDGFTVIGLGYNHPSTISPAVVAQDYLENMRVQGWPLYRTNIALNDTLSLDTQAWIAANPDVLPPVWDTTGAGFVGSGDPAPTPRVGAQRLVAGDASVTVQWDVARDQTAPVRYNLYYSSAATPGPIGGVDWTKIPNAQGSAPVAYVGAPAPFLFANEYTITGLTNGLLYSVAVRAVDSLPSPLEEANTVVLTTRPYAGAGTPHSTYAPIGIDGDMGDWPAGALVYEDPQGDAAGGPSDVRRVWMANDASHLYLRIDTWNAHDLAGVLDRAYFDTDRNVLTGFNVFGLSLAGSEMLMEFAGLYSQADGGFNNGAVGTASVAPTGNPSTTSWEFAFSRSLLHPTTLSGTMANQPVFGADGSSFGFLFTSDNGPSPGEFVPDGGSPLLIYEFAPPPSYSDSLAVFGS